MNSTIHLFYINFFTSLIIVSLLIVYRFIFPKRKISIFSLLIIISVLPLVSSLRPGTYESGDLSEHVKNAITFYRSLSEGNLIPRWSDTCNGMFGCPDFEFLYILPYYFISFVHFFGLSFISGAKLLLGISFIASGIGIYLWVKDEFGDIAGFIAGIFYLFSPYHLLDMHIRSSLGENVAFALIPYSFLFVKKLIQKEEKKWFFANSIIIMLLLLSHLVAAIITVPLTIFYAIILLDKNKRKKSIGKFVNIISSQVLGFFLAAFYWLPIAFEQKSVFWGQHGSVSFSSLSDLLFSPYRFGLLLQGPMGENSHMIGYTHLAVFLIAIYFLYKSRQLQTHQRMVLLFFIITIFLTLFMILPISKPLWYLFPLIKSFQFSYRLLIIVSLASSVVAGIVLTKFSKRVVFVFCLVTIVISILNWGNRRAIPNINDAYLQNELLTIDKRFSLASPIWSQKDRYVKTERITTQLETISGQASIHQIGNLSTEREFLINNQTGAIFKANILYFPGWTVLANYKTINSTHSSKDYPGLIVFSLPRGSYLVKIKFRETLIRILSNYISLGAFFVVFLYSIVNSNKSE